ncbi:MAG: 50S ribosomal protein L19, partial [Thermoleophilaceae bacterium]
DVRRAKLYYLRDRVGRAARVRERRFTGTEDLEGVMPPPEADADAEAGDDGETPVAGESGDESDT